MEKYAIGRIFCIGNRFGWCFGCWHDFIFWLLFYYFILDWNCQLKMGISIGTLYFDYSALWERYNRDCDCLFDSDFKGKNTFYDRISISIGQKRPVLSGNETVISPIHAVSCTGVVFSRQASDRMGHPLYHCSIAHCLRYHFFRYVYCHIPEFFPEC